MGGVRRMNSNSCEWDTNSERRFTQHREVSRLVQFEWSLSDIALVHRNTKLQLKAALQGQVTKRSDDEPADVSPQPTLVGITKHRLLFIAHSLKEIKSGAFRSP